MHPFNDVKQPTRPAKRPAHVFTCDSDCFFVSRLLPVPAPQLCVRVVPSFSYLVRTVTPNEGWMERRQAHSFFLSRLRGATPALVRRGPVPVRPGPLSALHRGDFRPRTHAVVSGSGPPEPQRLPAPGRNCLAVGVRTSRSAVRATAAGRHSPLRLQDRLRRRPS